MGLTRLDELAAVRMAPPALGAAGPATILLLLNGLARWGEGVLGAVGALVGVGYCWAFLRL